MKQWFINNLWWILQVLACTAVYSNNILAKIYGLTWFTYGWNVGTCILITAWAFCYSYQISTTFIAPWFIATGVLSLYGFMGSLFFDIGILSWKQILGAILTLVGGVLLVL